MGNNGTSANSSSHAESSLRLNEFAERTVGSLSNILRLALNRTPYSCSSIGHGPWEV